MRNFNPNFINYNNEQKNCSCGNHSNNNCQNSYQYSDEDSYMSSDYDEIQNDELFKKSTYLQQESRRLNNDAKGLRQKAVMLNEKAKQLERESKELFAKSRSIFDEVYKMEKESESKMELSSFYYQKYYEGYKNMNFPYEDYQNPYKKDKCKISMGCTPKSL